MVTLRRRLKERDDTTERERRGEAMLTQDLTYYEKVRLYDELKADQEFIWRYWGREDYLRTQHGLARDFERILVEKALSEKDRAHVTETLNKIRRELAEEEDKVTQSQGYVSRMEQTLTQVKEELAQAQNMVAQKDAEIAELRRQLGEKTSNS